jgi:osmotically-inducible protein OsmY
VDWTARTAGRWKRLPAVTAPQIRRAIGAALDADPRLQPGSAVRVEVQKGTVTLHGKVPDLLSRRAAVEDARNTYGVVSVKDRLRVAPSRVLADEVLHKRVAALLRSDGEVHALGLKVRVSEGRVTLQGVVPSEADRQLALRRISRVDGVLGIRDETRLAPRKANLSDRQLRRRLQRRIFWNAYLVPAWIRVRVKGGVAHLTGKVPSLYAARAASAAAHAVGAKRVENDLTVHPPGQSGKPEAPKQ